MPLAMRGVRTTRDLGQQTEHLSTQEALLWLGSVIEHGFAGSVSRDAGVELQRNAAPQTMRFLTYNVLGLPWALGLGTGKSWRYARIGDEIARLSPDVVALQEMFCPKTAALIAHAGYPHQALSRSMHGALGLFGGSGLAIISKHPVEFIREHTFVAKSGVEKQARKGLLLARLRTPNGLLDVLTGHLASPPESINCLVASSETAARVRAKQILELAAFLRQRPDADQVPLLSLGDWNVCEESHQYHDLKDHLGLDLHRERCPYELIQDQGLGREDRDHIAGYTFDPDRNLMAEGKENEPMRFDYIFYNGNRNERLAVRSGFEFVSPSLQYSDHFAPLVTLYSSR
jgi:endonuclease/exonuclease/phosphatase family metal-dependent hydrolase